MRKINNHVSFGGLCINCEHWVGRQCSRIHSTPIAIRETVREMAYREARHSASKLKYNIMTALSLL